MGIFDKFMNALGFMREEDLEGMENPKPAKKSADTKPAKKQKIIDFTPKTQDEVYGVAKFLKNGLSVRVNFKKFDEEALHRAVDFLEGVCFVLEIEPVHAGGRVLEFIQ